MQTLNIKDISIHIWSSEQKLLPQANCCCCILMKWQYLFSVTHDLLCCQLNYNILVVCSKYRYGNISLRASSQYTYRYGGVSIDISHLFIIHSSFSIHIYLLSLLFTFLCPTFTAERSVLKPDHIDQLLLLLPLLMSSKAALHCNCTAVWHFCYPA